ncbi:unnamed protein product [Pleuronectes platessa]|uniref:Uncharacterized protein n=1 Tax=Pleuronectes platessa TaxID=8262 RepID=A0A9N7TP42_PLEPL|nr:unnamed protein product [Pleuronectes platessa]
MQAATQHRFTLSCGAQMLSMDSGDRTQCSSEEGGAAPEITTAICLTEELATPGKHHQGSSYKCSNEAINSRMCSAALFQAVLAEQRQTDQQKRRREGWEEVPGNGAPPRLVRHLLMLSGLKGSRNSEGGTGDVQGPRG